MGSMEEIEGRVTALETQMRDVRRDAAAARVLAGGADRDVSAFAARLDAHQRLLEALRETQIEHGQWLAGHDQRFISLEQRFDGLEQRFDRLESEMRRGFSTAAVGQAEILALLRRLSGPDEEVPSSAE